jgi:hypothetical protein
MVYNPPLGFGRLRRWASELVLVLVLVLLVLVLLALLVRLLLLEDFGGLPEVVGAGGCAASCDCGSLSLAVAGTAGEASAVALSAPAVGVT